MFPLHIREELKFQPLCRNICDQGLLKFMTNGDHVWKIRISDNE